MQTYIRSILKPQNFPNWFGIFGVISTSFALILLVYEKESESKSDKIQSIILEHLETTGSARIEDVLPYAKEYDTIAVVSEFYTLVSKRILLKTSVGFELKRFSTRLDDEIELIISYDYPDCNCIDNINKLDSAVLNVKKKLKQIEKIRKGDDYSDDLFCRYIEGLDWYIREKFYKMKRVHKMELRIK